MDQSLSNVIRRFAWQLLAAVALIVAVASAYQKWAQPLSAEVDLCQWQVGLQTLDQWSNHEPSGAMVALERSNPYVGTQACRECHPGQFESYMLTSHSRACRETDPTLEADDFRFWHDKSSREYAVFREAGKLYHSETLVGKQRQKLAVTKLPIKYTVGSGSHGNTYLYESDGFLFESPVSWYSGNGWAMSPGYDSAQHQGVTRVANESCVYCHVGMIERSASNAEKFKVVETAIGCERCHGPGHDHRDRHQDATLQLSSGSLEISRESKPDPIVNPGKLPRDLSEAVCQQCHLQGLVVVTESGKSLWDFRPGQSLSENRTDFQLATDQDHKIVGHFEQMYESKCYQGTDELTCITCHDPHHQSPASDTAKFYRDICLSCHEPGDCGIDQEVRHTTNENACTQCHMPKGNTNVPHVALSQHAIGIYPKPPKPRVMRGASEFRPVVANPTLSKDELDRREALAVQYGVQSAVPLAQVRAQYDRSVKVSYEIMQQGVPDWQVAATLARSAINAGNESLARQLANKVLAVTERGSLASNDARAILAEIAFSHGENSVALDHYRELTTVRRQANDYALLGLCLRNAGQTNAAIEVLRKAATIQPDLQFVHETLATLLGSDDAAHAENHTVISRELITP